MAENLPGFDPVPTETPSREQVLKALDLQELLDLRKEIDALLPSSTLKDMNMEQQLVQQLLIVQQLQQEVITDQNTPANQRAQVANSVASTMQTLAKLQVELYDSERLKRLEQILIDCVKDLPLEVQEEFMERYERELGGLNA